MADILIKSIRYRDLSSLYSCPDLCITKITHKVLIIRIETDGFFSSMGMLKTHLTREELERSQRFVSHDASDRWVIYRAILRIILAKILRVAPIQIPIHVKKHGKPYLAKRFDLDLRFNLSHSRNYALYALAIGHEVGIDIEEDRSNFCISMAELVLCEYEMRGLMLLPPCLQKQAFLRLWTKKEAISKVFGQGLMLDFKEMVLGVSDGPSPKRQASFRGIDLFDLSDDRCFATLAIDSQGIAG